MFFKKKSRIYYRVQTYGSPVLHKKAQPVKKVNNEIRELAASMLETMRRFDGIGLAGPQAGVNLRIVALGVPANTQNEGTPATLSPGEITLLPQMPMVIINPVITWRSDNMAVREEGCLSLPGIYGEVERPDMIKFTAETLNGETITADCGGLLARCLQHECDHLDGKLFIDRMTEENLGVIKPKLKRLKKRGRNQQFVRVLGGE